MNILMPDPVDTKAAAEELLRCFADLDQIFTVAHQLGRLHDHYCGDNTYVTNHGQTIDEDVAGGLTQAINERVGYLTIEFFETEVRELLTAVLNPPPPPVKKAPRKRKLGRKKADKK